ncbi:YggU family protein [Candidatus Woesearchaeota archaeon]|nr:YggU family protein [Candidatus Woesearchaeota archaeon]
MNNRIAILVKPNARRSEILGWYESRKALRIAVAAPPEKDKANKELINFLSKLLKKKVQITHGAKSREKIISISEKVH